MSYRNGERKERSQSYNMNVRQNISLTFWCLDHSNCSDQNWDNAQNKLSQSMTQFFSIGLAPSRAKKWCFDVGPKTFLGLAFLYWRPIWPLSSPLSTPLFYTTVWQKSTLAVQKYFYTNFGNSYNWSFSNMYLSKGLGQGRARVRDVKYIS